MAAFYALTSAMYIYILIKYSDNFVKLLQLPTPKPPRACSFLSIKYISSKHIPESSYYGKTIHCTKITGKRLCYHDMQDLPDLRTTFGQPCYQLPRFTP